MALPELEPIWQGPTQQRVYRQVLQALARPGTTQSLAEQLQDAPSHVAVLACLIDDAVSLADPHRLLSDAERGLLAAKPTDTQHADFILMDGSRSLEPSFTPRRGTLESPEQSATILLRVASLTDGTRTQCTGPGIDGSLELRVAGLHADWWAARDTWCTQFPLGVDMLLVTNHEIVGLPRTTRV